MILSQSEAISNSPLVRPLGASRRAATVCLARASIASMASFLVALAAFASLCFPNSVFKICSFDGVNINNSLSSDVFLKSLRFIIFMVIYG